MPLLGFAPILPQRCPQDADNTKSDTGVSHVESRPVISAPVEIKKVDHLAVAEAIDQVPYRSADDRGDGDHDGVICPVNAAEKQEEGEDCDPCRNEEKRLAEPSRHMSEEAEGCSRIIHQGQVEEGCDNGHRFMHIQGANNQCLADLVQHQNTTD